MDRVPATQIPRSWLFKRHFINRLTSLQHIATISGTKPSMLLEISPVALHLHLEGQSILLSGTCGTCGIVHIVSLPSLFSGSTCRKPSSNDVRQLRMSGKAMDFFFPLEAKQVWWDAPLLFGHTALHVAAILSFRDDSWLILCSQTNGISMYFAVPFPVRGWFPKIGYCTNYMPRLG